MKLGIIILSLGISIGAGFYTQTFALAEPAKNRVVSEPANGPAVSDEDSDVKKIVPQDTELPTQTTPQNRVKDVDVKKEGAKDTGNETPKTPTPQKPRKKQKSIHAAPEGSVEATL
jgi:hypothetical protein